MRTRFTVDSAMYFDDAAAAIAAAKRMIYVSPTDEQTAVERLQRGEAVALVYGFTSVHVTVEPVMPFNQVQK